MPAGILGRGPSGRGGGKVHDIGPSPAVRQFTAFGADIDLTVQTTQPFATTRKLLVSNVGVGTKLLVYIGPDNVQVSLDMTNLQGVALEIEAITIKSTTTVTGLIVMY